MSYYEKFKQYIVFAISFYLSFKNKPKVEIIDHMRKCQTLSSDKLLFIDTSLPSYLQTMHSFIYQALA